MGTTEATGFEVSGRYDNTGKLYWCITDASGVEVRGIYNDGGGPERWDVAANAEVVLTKIAGGELKPWQYTRHVVLWVMSTGPDTPASIARIAREALGAEHVSRAFKAIGLSGYMINCLEVRGGLSVREVAVALKAHSNLVVWDVEPRPDDSELGWSPVPVLM